MSSHSLAAALTGIVMLSAGANGQIVFSEGFENPDVAGFADNTVPSGGKWIGSSQGFGATNRGLYNEAVAWPETPKFTTPFGKQSYFLNYSNSGLTTSVGATGQTVAAGVTYRVKFNAGMLQGVVDGSYLVELVAFGPGDTNATRNEARAGRPGTVLASATGPVVGSDMSTAGSIVFTPAPDNVHLGKDLGIRLVKATNNVLYDNVRLILGHDYNPSPAFGMAVIGGNVTLNWTNLPATTGSDVWVDVWYGDSPGTMAKILSAGQNATSAVASVTTSGDKYWRIDTYVNGAPTGTPVSSSVFDFTVEDFDGDGLPDDYEWLYSGSITGLVPGLDDDTDGLTNMQEYFYGTFPDNQDSDGDTLIDGAELAGVDTRPPTSPVSADTDNDGLDDMVETNTGTWASASNTGTNPVDSDWDKDGLKDGVETNNNTFIDRFSTGSNPFLADSDMDGAADWYEAAAALTNPNNNAEKPKAPYPLPDPDGSTGTPGVPVKVYIMAGQSNTVGIGQVNGTLPGSLDTITKREHKFPNLLDGSNNWSKRNDVIYKGVVSATAAGPLTAGQGASSGQLGPELGFGHLMGWYHDEPVLIIKASQGNRSLGWDFLPPGSEQWVLADKTYPGYGQSPQSWLTASGAPAPGGWYAGKQYDDCFRAESAMGMIAWANGTAYANGVLVRHNGTAYTSTSAHTADASSEPGTGAAWSTYWSAYSSFNAHDILANGVLQNLPATGNNLNGRTYEIAGFCWWQGHKDQDGSNNVYGPRYEANLVKLINALRADFNAPNAPFVVATIGFGGAPLSNKQNDFQQVYNAQMAVGNPALHPQFAGTVKSVDILPYWRTIEESPVNQDYHYNQSAETYMLVGDAMGRAMLEMQNDITPPSPDPMSFAIAPTAVNATTVGMVATTAVDVSGPVQYYFENTSNSTNSGWITGTRWDSTGLTNGVSQNFRVKARDANGTETNWSATFSAAPGTDATAPAPAPAFATPPTAQGENSVSMSATAASDINGVEYYFDCTVGGGTDSGWQAIPQFTATGLTPATQYTFVVRARDSVGNVTADSAPASATTASPDGTPPSPDPTSFAIPPAATGINAITMTAATASDASGVQYYFEAVSGGTSSGWQDGATYTDTSLSPGTQYGYRVRARDKSPAQNTTAWSGVFSATTEVPDETPPSPDPMSFAVPPAKSGSSAISMTAATATDDADVEYLFANITTGTDSGWQSSPVFIDTNLQPETQYSYQVKARDTSENFNETAFSAPASATTAAAGAAAIIYEPFADGDPTLPGNTAGKGLSGTWSATASRFAVNSGSLSWGSLPTTGNKVAYVPTGNAGFSVGTNADLADAGLLGDGATLWFSLLVNTPGEAGTNPDTGFGFGTDPVPTTGMQGSIGAGKAAIGLTIKGGKLQASIWNGGTNVRGNTGPAVAANVTKFVVGKIVWGSNSTNTTLDLYLPDTSLVIGQSVNSATALLPLDSLSFDTISAGLKANALVGFGVDELRFGSTYESVIGQGGTGGGDPFAAWVGNIPDLTDNSPSLDFDKGGLATALEWVLGGDPADGGDDASIMPTFNNTTDPDFFIFTYNRADAAAADGNTTIAVEYGNTMGGWTKAVAGADILINETSNGAVDTVQVKIRRSLAGGGKLFARLKVGVAVP